jgi:flagellar assembly protein FliH
LKLARLNFPALVVSPWLLNKETCTIMASILKQHGTSQGRDEVRASAFNFDDMTSKAEAYLKEVRTQAAQILAEAQAKAQAVREQAKRDGQRDAVAEAERALQSKVQQQLQSVVPAIQQAVANVERERAAWLRRWEDDAIRLAVAIAERVIRQEVSRQPEITLELVRDSLQLAAGMGALKICLNPRDYASLCDGVKKVVAEMKQLAATEVVADASVSPGGCRVDSQFGSIDQQFESQLARIRDELTVCQ